MGMPCAGRQISPYIPGAAREPPAFAAFLARNGYEAEIADRSAVGTHIPLNERHTPAGLRRHIGMARPMIPPPITARSNG